MKSEINGRRAEALLDLFEVSSDHELLAKVDLPANHVGRFFGQHQ